MNTAAIIVISILVLAIVFTITTIMYVIKDADHVFLQKRLEQQTINEPRPASAPVYWTENLRNNKNFESFPPCFERDSNAKNIFGIMLRLNLMQRYYHMIDVLSVLLCLQQLQAKACRTSDIKDRMVQIVGLGGNANDKASQEKAAAFIPVNDTLLSKFLVASIDLLEKQMKIMRSDSAVSKADADSVSGHLYSFYVANFPVIYKTCTDVPSL
jgi:hypothetical protein